MRTPQPPAAVDPPAEPVEPQPQPSGQARPNGRLPANARLAVRFLSRWQNYFAGDVATFPARMASTLVARGKAERVNVVQSPEPPAGAQWAMRPVMTPQYKSRDVDDDLDII